MVGGLPDHLKRLALRVAQHEMGHYVVARVLGVPTSDVSLEIIGPIDGHRGEADVRLAQPLFSLRDVEMYLRRRVKVLYAGALAETLPARAPVKQVDNERAIKILRCPGNGAEQDYAKVRELIHLLRNVRQQGNELNATAIQAELDSLSHELWNEARQLVEKHAETIVGLAFNLASRVHEPKRKVAILQAELEALPAVKALTPE